MWKSLSVLFVFTILWSLVLSHSEHACTCMTPLGRKSVCVSIFKCPNLLKASEQKPLAKSVVSFLRKSKCGYDGNIPKVCCGPLPSDQEKPATQRPMPRPTQAPSRSNSSYHQKDSSLAPRKQCGVDTNGDRIYGGQFTELDEFPWMALLRFGIRKPMNLFLVNQDQLARHKINNPNDVKVSHSEHAYTCMTPLGRKSVCVSIFKCPNLLKACEQKSLAKSVASFLRKSKCGYDGNIPKVCCGPLPSDQEKPATQRPMPRPTQAPSRSNSSYHQKDSSLAPRNQCGVDTNGDRIYGGQFTELDEFPWMALLGYRIRNQPITYQCGGGLINHRYILTAAHCITGKIIDEKGHLTTVRLGEHNTQTEIDCVDSMCADPPQEILVASAYPHPGYSDKNKNRRDDIGIVRLATRVKYTYYVQPICIIHHTEPLEAGDNVYVAGWGKTLNGKNSPIKLKLSLPIFDKEDCVSKYRKLGVVLGENQLCAGGVFVKDACRGDSGGPLMKRRPEGIWEAVGVVSFGYGCGRDGWPGVYISVAKYTDWIRNTLKKSNV